MPIPEKLTKEEVMQQLFDALMESIEPKLMISQRKETSSELAAMPPKIRAEWMGHYKSCYEEFMKQWPEFVARATMEVSQMGDTLVQMSGDSDASRMQSLEESFGDDTSSSSKL
jgi:hypothetical protein